VVGQVVPTNPATTVRGPKHAELDLKPTSQNLLNLLL